MDTCATKRKLLRIAGDDKPAEVVRSRMKKLNADHIRFVLNSLAENATPVRNMKQYLLASLYNAPTTMNLHYHANIHKALKYAVKIDLIPTNPADKVERPKKNEFKGNYYSAEEIHALSEIAQGTKLEIPVLLASFYGLRRSEVLGLKWDAIDFEENTLDVKHIVTQASIDGKKVLIQADRAKTKSSLRTLPLVPPIRDRLLTLKGEQETYRRLCGKCYNSDFSTTANIYAHLDYTSKLSSAQAMLEGLGYGNASA